MVMKQDELKNHSEIVMNKLNAVKENPMRHNVE
jgi:hypothetical protein